MCSKTYVTAVSVALLLSLLCVFRFETLRIAHFSSQTLKSQRVTIIQAESEGTRMRIVFDISSGEHTSRCIGSILAPWEPLYGDTARMDATIESVIDDSYGHYLRSQGVTCTAQLKNIALIRKGNPLHPFRTLQKLKKSVESSLEKTMNEPHSALAKGLLTGTRSSLPKHITDAFRTTGLTHVLAISGYNITMILNLLSALLCWLPLRKRFIPSLITIVAFTFFVGASASVVRAAIMGVLSLLALTNGRTQTLRLSVLWTLAFMTAWNPLQLWWDSGLLLSFLALLGIMEFNPLLKPYTEKIFPSRFGIEEAMRTTLSAQLLTNPWILFAFGRVSLIAPLSNILILPAVPFTMLTGFLTATSGLIFLPLGRLFALTTLPFSGWILGVTEVLARIPFASIDWQASLPVVLFCYAGLFAWWYKKNFTLSTTRSSEGTR